MSAFFPAKKLKGQFHVGCLDQACGFSGQTRVLFGAHFPPGCVALPRSPQNTCRGLTADAPRLREPRHAFARCKLTVDIGYLIAIFHPSHQNCKPKVFAAIAYETELLHDDFIVLYKGIS